MSLLLEAVARRLAVAISRRVVRVVPSSRRGGTALKRLRFLSHLMIGTGIILLGPTSFAQTIGQSPVDSREVVEQPTTLIEMLKNIDVARTRGLLLHRDFYSDANLKKFLGALAIERFSYTKGTGTEGWINDLGRMIRPQDLGNGSQTKGFSFRFHWGITDAGLVDAGLSLSFRGTPSLDFDGVERLFGPNWTLEGPAAPPPDTAFVAPTRPHGNETIEYRYVTPKATQFLHFSFNRDAELNAISVFAKEIK